MSGFKTLIRSDGIHHWTYYDFKRDTTDEWIETAFRLMHEYDAENKHFRCMVRFKQGALPTPYVTSQGMYFLRNRPKSLALSVAMIAENSLILRIIQFATQQVPGSNYIRFFQNEDECLAWLNERQASYEENGHL